MTPETAQELRDLMHRKGTSATEIVRRAIGVYKFLSDQLDCLEHDGDCRHGSGRTLEILDPEQEEALQITIS